MFEKLLSPSLSGYEALGREQPGSSEDTDPRTVQDRQQAVSAKNLDGRDEGPAGSDMSIAEAGVHRTMDSNLAGSASENLSSLKLIDVEEEVSAPAAVFLLADPLEKSFSGDIEVLIETAIPVKRWFRAIISLVQLVVGGICIQVGMREEDTVCQATFCSLLILSGVFQIVHSFVGMRFVIRRLGTEAEETRMILWCVEFILWLSVLHAVVTNSCENLKLQAMASLYLTSTFLLWLITGILWSVWFLRVKET
uniref:Uncharacterized protein n=1 Tax=Guillardia theta TaxID=55529 RepID=A0A7S4KQG5_GUITH|mmetsp:Transcript_29077/g.93571  ORF Transcript_29077/g.93571 Transcript_29077/m.93571 type:complete len:252 (+) Transcript_29077:219-974(+)